MKVEVKTIGNPKKILIFANSWILKEIISKRKRIYMITLNFSMN
jgi:hypothetical protein